MSHRLVVLALRFGTDYYISGAALSVMSYLASANMHGKALQTALHAPMSFFDTTPLGKTRSAPFLLYVMLNSSTLGRILGIFGKDMDSKHLSLT